MPDDGLGRWLGRPTLRSARRIDTRNKTMARYRHPLVERDVAMDDGNYHTRKVCAHFGLAIYQAQVVEHGVVNLLTLAKISSDPVATREMFAGHRTTGTDHCVRNDLSIRLWIMLLIAHPRRRAARHHDRTIADRLSPSTTRRRC